ncbi:MAG: hypothetical protein KF698_08190 [Anaerolineales bacterium]|nr:hypothetical protein [Anaerolineales bacterium]
MSDQQDLSLLTDEQLAALKKLEYSDSKPTPFLRELIAECETNRSALIAARAENKRKDEVIELADALAFRTTEYVCDIESAGDGSEHWKLLTHRLAEYKELRALLQSEKERCPVHDFELPCLGCAELALHVGVDEQEQSEKGGAE